MISFPLPDQSLPHQKFKKFPDQLLPGRALFDQLLPETLPLLLILVSLHFAYLLLDQILTQSSLADTFCSSSSLAPSSLAYSSLA